MTGIIEAYGLLFFTALFLSLLVTPLTIRLARTIGVMDTPNERSMHTQSKTRLGGLGMAAALGVSAFVFMPFNTLVAGFLAGLVVIVLIGLVDDIYQIRALYKLVGQIVAAAVFILISGKTLATMGNLFGTGELVLGVLEIPVTIFCIAGFINALNLSDGLDGLAGGIAAIASLFLVSLAVQAQQWETLGILTALFGAIIGFLRYNTYPAKLFMGDTGSLFLGYTLATCSVMMLADTADGDPIAIKPVTLLVILAIPLIDTTYVMTRRAILGMNPFHPDKTHLHHKLIALGIPHGGVVSLLYLGMFLFGVLSILMVGYPDWMQALITVLIGIATYITIARLQRAELGRWMGVYERFTDFDHRLLGISRSFLHVTTRYVGILASAALLAPIFFMEFPGTQMGWVVVAFIGLMVIFFPWLRKRSHIGLLRGTLYLAIFLLLFLYNLLLVPTNEWLGSYLNILSISLLVWVILKLFVKREEDIVMTTGYEVFALTFTWILPVAIVPAIVSDENRFVIDIIWHSCLLSIPVLLAIRLFLRREPGTQSVVLLAFILAFMVLGFKLINP